MEARSVSKHFGGVRAVSDVSLAVPAGEIYAVIGPNGAGKTTFLRMLSGEMVPTSGHILLRGQDITGRSVTAINQAGIAKSYQINQLFNDLTGRQNLRIAALGRHRGTLRFDVFRAADSIAEVEQSIAALIDELGLAAAADLPVATLAYGEKRRIELGLALATLPSVLLLDEPLAGLSPGERQDVIRLIRRLAEGRTIVLVEHDMDAVFALAATHHGHARGPPARRGHAGGNPPRRAGAPRLSRRRQSACPCLRSKRSTASTAIRTCCSISACASRSMRSWRCSGATVPARPRR